MTKNNQELRELSSPIFAQFPDANTLYATRDGQFFLDENRARLHAGKGQVVPIHKDEDDTEEGQAIALNAKETAKQIMEVKTIAELEPYADDQRVAVKKAYDRRLAELSVSTGNNPQNTNPENRN
jgi:hypothetical protein